MAWCGCRSADSWRSDGRGHSPWNGRAGGAAGRCDYLVGADGNLAVQHGRCLGQCQEICREGEPCPVAPIADFRKPLEQRCQSEVSAQSQGMQSSSMHAKCIAKSVVGPCGMAAMAAVCALRLWSACAALSKLDCIILGLRRHQRRPATEGLQPAQGCCCRRHSWRPAQRHIGPCTEHRDEADGDPVVSLRRLLRLDQRWQRSVQSPTWVNRAHRHATCGCWRGGCRHPF